MKLYNNRWFTGTTNNRATVNLLEIPRNKQQ